MGKELRVIHVTTHVALRRVPDLVTRIWTRGRVRNVPFAVEPIRYS